MFRVYICYTEYLGMSTGETTKGVKIFILSNRQDQRPSSGARNLNPPQIPLRYVVRSGTRSFGVRCSTWFVLFNPSLKCADSTNCHFKD